MLNDLIGLGDRFNTPTVAIAGHRPGIGFFCLLFIVLTIE